MSRIAETFERLKKEGRKGLVAYMTAGDPDMTVSEKNIRCALDNGVDVLELGVPFSDPTADGPAIQAASQRALASGVTVAKVLELVRRLRADYAETPMILFGYANPLLSYGYEKVCADAAAAGADGMLLVNIPPEEEGEIRGYMTRNGLAMIRLIAPTTPRDRAERILEGAEGFVYYIMVRGVTGKREELASDLESHVKELRGCTDLPIGVGFGVSNGEQAAAAAACADAVVVGSALVEAAREGGLTELVRELRQALGT